VLNFDAACTANPDCTLSQQSGHSLIG